MLYLSGIIQNVIEKQYQNKDGKTVKSFDVDIKEENERFFTTVNVDNDHAGQFTKGDEVNLPVSAYPHMTKAGTPFISFRLNNKHFEEME